VHEYHSATVENVENMGNTPAKIPTSTLVHVDDESTPHKQDENIVQSLNDPEEVKSIIKEIIRSQNRADPLRKIEVNQRALVIYKGLKKPTTDRLQWLSTGPIFKLSKEDKEELEQDKLLAEIFYLRLDQNLEVKMAKRRAAAVPVQETETVHLKEASTFDKQEHGEHSQHSDDHSQNPDPEIRHMMKMLNTHIPLSEEEVDRQAWLIKDELVKVGNRAYEIVPIVSPEGARVSNQSPTK
jgi:hypothetical protein